MDLANMRSLGVRSIFATCDCGRRASVDVAALSAAVTVPALRWRLRRSSCGVRPNDVRPDWREHRMGAAGETRKLREVKNTVWLQSVACPAQAAPKKHSLHQAVDAPENALRRDTPQAVPFILPS